ncbi:MAG: response regulator transcription factor [Actinomycetota bacterium]|nr:response regulator transcription factor [Actinomycetota bacterium]
MKERILIVDDEEKIVKLVKAYLDREGYVTLEAFDGDKALELWRRESPDLVVLDILMPGVDGLELCREVRQTSQVPIIILSAKSRESDKLVGYELGADDYVTKPFSPRELVARIRAILRRKVGEVDGTPPLVEGPLVIDTDKHKVEVEGVEIALTPTEFGILEVLVSHPGWVYSRGQLIKAVQGDYFEGYDRTVDAHVKNIRRKIGEHAIGWNFIETVYGVGYRFRAAQGPQGKDVGKA